MTASIRNLLLSFVLLAFTPAGSALAQTLTWTGAALDGGNWNNAANWSPMTFPDSAAADAIFGPSAVNLVSVPAAFQVRSLTFTSGTNNYNLTFPNPIPPAGSFLTGLQTITVANTVTATQTINLPPFATGALLFTGSALTIANNALPTAVASPTLLIGPFTTIGTPDSGGITVTGTGTTTFSGAFATNASGNQVIGGLRKTGPGTLTLSGNGSNLVGVGVPVLTLAGGTVRLDYSANTASKLGAGSLTSLGGDLLLVPHASTAVTQNLASTALTAGHTEINVPQVGANITLGLGTISDFAGVTLNFSLPSTPFLVTTTTGNTNGLLGSGPAFATINGSNWAAASGGILSNVTGTNTFSPGVNTDISTNNSLGGLFTTNSLRFVANGLALNLSDAINTNLTFQSGGILLPSNVATGTITGGTLLSGQNELIAHVHGADLTIGSDISAGGGITKTGPGTLTLSGDNDGLAGPVNVNRGHLRITHPFAFDTLDTINFNDTRTGSVLQVFTVEVGDNTDAATNAAIRLSGYSAPGQFDANFFSTGTSLNSRVTLVGVIASAAGAVTPLGIIGASNDTSGFNLTAANTFTGAVRVHASTLGINSNASLGNPANALLLSTASSTTGGLEFLNGGIDVARTVTVNSTTRVVSNGIDVNIISGPVTGATLVKAGTGTLVLTNAGNAGTRDIRGGTLRVSAGALGTTGNVLIGDGATLAVTGTDTFAAGRSLFLGSAAVVGSTATIDVAANQTFAVAALVANNTGSIGTLVKTGAGALSLTRPDNTYTGGTVVGAGTVLAAADGSLGAAAGPVTINPLGTLRYTASTSTARTFTMFNGSLDVPSGVTLNMNGATVGGGFLRGAGSFQLTGSSSLTGVTTFTNTNLNVTGPASVSNFAHNGILTVASGQTLALNYGTNGSAGRTSINGTANVTEFVSNGLLTVPNGGLMNNTGSNMVLGGGSRTFVGSVANPGGKIDLGGQQLLVAGGLLVTNGGSFGSGNGVRNGVTVADFGALVKGTGPYQSVITQNGGQFLPGNSPGTSEVGTFAINGGGGLIFQITDAGPSATFPSAPGLPGINPGWGLTKIFSSLDFTATPSSPFTITMQTQLPPPAAPDVPGLMSSFDPNRAYQWMVFELQTGAVLNGTFDPNAINFATAQFVNSTAGGAFSLTRNGGQIFLTFTPVPEPGLILVAVVGAAGLWRGIRRRPFSRSAH